jgi:integrase/recombinase XerD
VWLADASFNGTDPEKEAVMNDPSRVRVSGPLAAYRVGFAEELARQGYTAGSAQRQVCLMAHLSRWLDGRGLGAAGLAADRVREFLAVRRADGYTLELSERGMAPLLGYLRGLGVTPVPPEPAAGTAAELLAQDYRRYLVSEQGLAPDTVRAYLGTARLFLCQREAQPGGLDLENLTAGQVTEFVTVQCSARRVAAAKALVTGLRSLLRYLYWAGLTGLAPAVPTPSGFAGGYLPRGLEEESVAALLGSCDRDTAVGQRDFAILTLLARLGLRAGEVSVLTLDDLDWHRGEITVRGKGSRTDRLPLPADVGEAVADYLQNGRPRSDRRAVFLRVRAPMGGLSRGGVGDVVMHACERAGLPRVGPHRLRHSAATAMLRGGASLAEVGQVLRQARSATTAIYAKVDRTALRALARPWPEATS